MQPPLANSYWVLPGSLLAGEYPYALADADTRERLQRLIDAGIDAFLDLTQPGEGPEYRRLLPPGVGYLRSAIADASVPAEHAQMRDIQAWLQDSLAQGRHIYVHCRAGIGRTGIVIGCYLAEQRLDGPAALEQLNSLWRQCARSATWPQVPQTAQQVEFVRDWPRHRQAGGEAASLAALRALRARFLGSLLGLAIGDALGAATQFRRAGSFAALGDLVGGGPFDLPRGAWSDDTAMALCLAESLLERDGFDERDQLHRYRRWQREGHLSATGQCLGITAATARTLALGPRDEPQAGMAAAAPISHEAAPLSRVAPAVLSCFERPAQGIARAADAARLFAAAPAAQDACRALAAMLHAALRAEPLRRVLQPPAPAFAAQALAPAVAALLARDPSAPLEAQPEPAVAALAAARWALASGDGFRSGALRVANLGGEADVAGAVYGQLAGAHYGAGAIPAGWLAALLRRPLIEDLADRLLTAALVRLA